MYFSGINGVYLYPDNEQKEFIDKCIEGYRIVYNWALDKEIEIYELYKVGKSKDSYIPYFSMTELYTNYYKTHSLLKNLPTHTMYNAIRDLTKAFEYFFKMYSEYPKYKSNEYELISSFRPRSEIGTFYFEGNMLKIESCPNKFIKTSYNSGFHKSDNIHYYIPCIKRNNRTLDYMISFLTLETKLDSYFIENNISKSEPIGVDVNKNIMYACSNGIMIEGSDSSRLEVGLANINRKISRDKELLKEKRIEDSSAVMSNNAKFRLNKRKHIFERIANLHRDIAYKGSLEIVRLNPECIIMEDLDIKDILSLRPVAKELQQHPLGISQRILKEQAFKYNIPIIYAPAKFPSSSYCSNCGTYKKDWNNEYFICPVCKTRIQRDLNAAINLKKWYTKELRYKNTSTGTYF